MAVPRKIFIERHEQMTYTGCKLSVKADLRSVAFSTFTACKIMPVMADQRIYLKAWRKHRHLTQDQVVARLEFFDDPNLPKTGASLSRLENGKQPYSQRVLEALSDIYQCDPSDLIGRDPTKEGDVIDIVRHLDARKRREAIAILTALQATGG